MQINPSRDITLRFVWIVFHFFIVTHVFQAFWRRNFTPQIGIYTSCSLFLFERMGPVATTAELSPTWARYFSLIVIAFPSETSFLHHLLSLVSLNLISSCWHWSLKYCTWFSIELHSLRIATGNFKLLFTQSRCKFICYYRSCHPHLYRASYAMGKASGIFWGCFGSARHPGQDQLRHTINSRFFILNLFSLFNLCLDY